MAPAVVAPQAQWYAPNPFFLFLSLQLFFSSIFNIESFIVIGMPVAVNIFDGFQCKNAFKFQMNNLNRQIIMQPKSIVAGTSIATVGGTQTVPVVAVTDSADEVQYFPRATKKLTVQGSTSSPPTSLGDTVNVVFRAPVVSSSSSNQSMRPPPPPPPKIKGHSEEPSSSIPDLGELRLSFTHNCCFRIDGCIINAQRTQAIRIRRKKQNICSCVSCVDFIYKITV